MFNTVDAMDGPQKTPSICNVRSRLLMTSVEEICIPMRLKVKDQSY